MNRYSGRLSRLETLLEIGPSWVVSAIVLDDRVRSVVYQDGRVETVDYPAEELASRVVTHVGGVDLDVICGRKPGLRSKHCPSGPTVEELMIRCGRGDEL